MYLLAVYIYLQLSALDQYSHLLKTLGGQSGCPCVNDQGEVIGILSQADRADKNKCFVVPTGEFLQLVSVARSWEEDATAGEGSTGTTGVDA